MFTFMFRSQWFHIDQLIVNLGFVVSNIVLISFQIYRLSFDHSSPMTIVHIRSQLLIQYTLYSTQHTDLAHCSAVFHSIGNFS
jgi:hypothetical protein